MSEIIIERTDTGRATEYSVEVFDDDGIVQFQDVYYDKTQAEEVGAQWLQIADAIDDYKLACIAIDEAYTEEHAEQARQHAQTAHDAVYSLGASLKLDLSTIDMSI